MMRTECDEKETQNVKRGLIGRYGNYGIDEFWLDQLWRYRGNVWAESYLGPAEKKSMRAWLRDAELIDRKGNPTYLFDVFYNEPYYARNKTVAGVILVNLCYNSALFRWAACAMPHELMLRDSVVEAMGEDLPIEKRKILARLLFRSVEHFTEPCMKYIRIERSNGKEFLSWGLVTGEEVSSIAFLYALYRYAESTEIYSFTITQMEHDAERYRGENLMSIARVMSETEGCWMSPLAIFRLSHSDTKRFLRGLSTVFQYFISVDIVYDLDNICLSPEKSSQDVIMLYPEVKEYLV